MAKEDNLTHKLTTEELRKGGINSGETRRRRKAIKEQLDLLLSLPLQNDKLKEQLRLLGIEEEEHTNQMAMAIALWNKVVTKGDVNAFNSIRDTIGEKPIEVQQINATINDPYDDLSVEELKKLANEE